LNLDIGIGKILMPSTAQPQSLDRAIGEAKKQAAQVADVATTAARKTAGSFEVALRELVETQPYTAVGIALAVGWLLGRMHRPL
jgi:ElaB/YqjD/DUF883 family membrane-anchored ribosome-binding protein